MNKYKYLFKNIGFLTISQFSSKILVFFLIPLYTNILTTSEYGTYDLLYSSICLLVPIMTMNIAEAALRYALDENADYADVFSVGFGYLLKATLVLGAGLCVNHILKLSRVVDDYAVMFLLLFFSTAFSGIMTGFARGVEKVSDLAVSGVVSTLTIIGLNLLLLLVLDWRLTGYFVANIVGVGAQGIYLFVRIRAWKYLKFTHVDPVMKKEMVSYSRPLIANSVAWWVNSTSGRYVVTWFCGMAANGIFSVGYKIPSMLNVFQSIFNQAWTLSAVKDIRSEDSHVFFTDTYRLYNTLMVLACSGLIMLNRFLAKFLYAGDFYIAWMYVPFLLISIVFGALSGHLGGILSAVKNTKEISRTTVYGSVLNLILTICTVPFAGPMGAAVATTVSYWLTFVLRYAAVKKYVKMEIPLGRDYLVYLILLVQSVMFFVYMQECLALYLIEAALVMLIVALNRQEVLMVFRKMIKR